MSAFWANSIPMPGAMPYVGHGMTATLVPQAPRSYYSAPQLTRTYASPEGYPIYCYTLRNGHQVMIESRPSDMVSLRTFVKTGSVYERPIQPSPLYRNHPHPSGIAHLDEHCHFLATQNFPKKNSWTAAVEGLGAQLNASTSEEWVQHELAFNKEDLRPMLDLHAESVLRPKYDAREISQEKTNVINEMSQRTHPVEARVSNKLWGLLFDRPQFQTLGSKQDVLNTTAKDLERFHQTFYRPDNMLTVISGRINPQEALAQIDRLFSGNPARPPAYAPDAIKCALRPNEVRSATIHDPSLSSSIVNLAFPAPPASDLKGRVAMAIISDVLGGSPTSLLEQQVKDRQRLASSVMIGYAPMDAIGSLECMVRTMPGQEQKALQATLQQVRVMSQWLLTPEKLAETKGRLKHQFKTHWNNVDGATFQMGLEAMRGGLDHYLQFEKLVETLTAEDVLQTARQYLEPNRYAVVFGVPGADNSRTGGHHL